MMHELPKLLRDEEGASLVEYSVLIGLVTAGVVGLIQSIGSSRIEETWWSLRDYWDEAELTQSGCGVDNQNGGTSRTC